jgi:hypothetical protein
MPAADAGSGTDVVLFFARDKTSLRPAFAAEV